MQAFLWRQYGFLRCWSRWLGKAWSEMTLPTSRSNSDRVNSVTVKHQQLSSAPDFYQEAPWRVLRGKFQHCALGSRRRHRSQIDQLFVLFLHFITSDVVQWATAQTQWTKYFPTSQCMKRGDARKVQRLARPGQMTVDSWQA